jgi:hypothetical protein
VDQSQHGRDGHAPFFCDAKSNFKETLVVVVYGAVMPKWATPGKAREQTPIRVLQSMGTREGKFAPWQVDLDTARIKGC